MEILLGGDDFPAALAAVELDLGARLADLPVA
jgi:hypothetical protein